MQRMLELNEQLEELYSLSLDGQKDSNCEDRDKMKKMLTKAMKTTLTDRQTSCLTMYYFNNMTMKQIGKELGLNQSTISRHINAARAKLRKLRAFV